MTEFTPGREVVHVRHDLQATKEILALVEDENSRLRVQVQELSAKCALQAKRFDEAHAAAAVREEQMSETVEASQREQERLEAELNESLSERQRLSQLLREVRSQVDGRLTKLVEEMQVKDEKIHTLQYKLRESEREKERLIATERTLSVKEQSIESLNAELLRAREDAQTMRLQESNARVELAVLREKMEHATQAAADRSAIAANSVSHEALSILPLYRDWATEMEKNLLDLEDMVENTLDQAIDTQEALAGGGARAPIQDRRRLAEMRRIERERIQRQSMLLTQSAGSFDDALAIAVQAIRACWDTTRYTFSKVKASAAQLHACGSDVLQQTRELMTSGDGVGFNVKQTKNPYDRTAAGANIMTRAHDDTVAALNERLQEAERAASRKESDHAKLLADKDAQISELQRMLRDATMSTSSAADARESALTADLRRSEAEVHRLNEALRACESDLRQERSNLQRVQDASRNEMQEALRGWQAKEDRASQILRDTSRTYEDKIRCLEEKLNDAVERSSRECASLRKSLEESKYKEEQLAKVVEESREKRLSLKKQKDDIAEELRQQKAVVGTQHRELNESQRVIESLRYELSRLRANLHEDSVHRAGAIASMHQQRSSEPPVDPVSDAVIGMWKRDHGRAQRGTGGSQRDVMVLPGGLVR